MTALKKIIFIRNDKQDKRQNCANIRLLGNSRKDGVLSSPVLIDTKFQRQSSVDVKKA